MHSIPAVAHQHAAAGEGSADIAQPVGRDLAKPARPHNYSLRAFPPPPQDSEFFWEAVRLKATAATAHYTSGCSHGEALRASFKLHYGLEPMEDPRLDKEFLDLVDMVSIFPSAVNEAAFYDSV